MRIEASAARAATKDIAFTTNADPMPTVAISTPLTAGPTRAPSWNAAEFRLMALRSIPGPTKSLAKDCLVGLSTAAAIPRTVASR